MSVEVRLGEVAEIIMGQSPPGITYNENGDGLPFFQGVADFGYRHPTPRVYCTAPSRIAYSGDIMISVRAPIGRVNVPEWKCAIGRGIAIVRPKDPEDARFIEFVLRYMEPYWHTIEGNGSVFGNATRADLEDLRLPWFLRSERLAIAGVLGALDDKIELNRRMNRTLEAIAQAVFRSWFVENEEAEGWDVVPLPEIIEVNPTRSLKKGDIAPYLDMANMPTQGHRGIEWRDRPFGSGTKFINGDTLLARITPCLENGKTAFVDFLKDGQVGWGSTEYIVLRPKPPLPPEYGYYLARSEDLRNYAIQNMTGTSGRQRTPASCFDSFLVSVPPEKLAKKFGEFAKYVIDKIRANDEESRALTCIRDTLLPKLMRGEVRVKDMV